MLSAEAYRRLTERAYTLSLGQLNPVRRIVPSLHVCNRRARRTTDLERSFFGRMKMP